MSTDGNKVKVWVSYADNRKDLSDAERFGELRDVFSSVGREYNGSKLIAHARAVLSKSHDDDYLLIIGDPTLSGICFAVMSELHGRVRVLRWNRDDFAYRPLELDFEAGQ
jgi:hypothetical protein